MHEEIEVTLLNIIRGLNIGDICFCTSTDLTLTRCDTYFQHLQEALEENRVKIIIEERS